VGTENDQSSNESREEKRRLPRCTVEEREERIDYTRQLLVDGHNLSDIKRLLQKRYGLSGNGARLYVRHARKRNRASLHLKGDEAAVLSVTWWRQQQQQCSAELASLNAELQRYQEREIDIEGMIDANLANESLQVEAARIAKKIDSVRRAVASARYRATKAQNAIDNILGNRAPTKLAITDSAGNDLPRDPRVLETRLVALGFALPALPEGTGGGLSQLPTLPPATRIEASARRLDS
jgi:hypothetical protein